MPKIKKSVKYTLILVIVALVIVCILAILGPAIGNIFNQLTST